MRNKRFLEAFFDIMGFDCLSMIFEAILIAHSFPSVPAEEPTFDCSMDSLTRMPCLGSKVTRRKMPIFDRVSGWKCVLLSMYIQ